MSTTYSTAFPVLGRFRRPHCASALSLVAALAMAAAGCAHGGDSADGAVARDAPKASLNLLRDWLTGSFSSEAQSKSDPDYFDIRLRMTPVWQGREDGPWLYVEQARADKQDQPYRQRIYRLSRIAGSGGKEFRSDVYELPQPATQYAGAWSDPTKLAGLSPDQLDLREGCSITLRYHPCEQAFTGSTTGTGCSSTINGAAYATSDVRITSAYVASWDRGYDAQGAQVWGAVKDAYRFFRIPE